MDALEAMRTIGATRYFRDEDVPDEVVYRAAESARFSPQGGNRQPVRLVVVRDPDRKRRLAELYLKPWRAYYQAALSGARELGAYDSAERALHAANQFAERFAEHPLIIVVCARIDALLVTDLELDRPPVVGGASIYPYVQNLCIALRVEGVGTAITTLAVASEPEVRELLGIPDTYLTAAHVVAGYPARGFPRRLTRLPVEETVFVDSFGNPIARPAEA